MPTGIPRAGRRRRPATAIRDPRHLTASVPGRLVDEIDALVGEGQRSAFVREACEALLAQRRLNRPA